MRIDYIPIGDYWRWELFDGATRIAAGYATLHLEATISARWAAFRHTRWPKLPHTPHSKTI